MEGENREGGDEDRLGAKGVRRSWRGARSWG